MLLAAIVTAVPRRVVCPRAYAWWLPRHPANVPAGRRAEPPGSGIFVPMDATIEIDGLRKRFAGKSTTMRVVLGLDAPDAGTAAIGGRPRTGHDGPRQRRGSGRGRRVRPAHDFTPFTRTSRGCSHRPRHSLYRGHRPPGHPRGGLYGTNA